MVTLLRASCWVGLFLSLGSAIAEPPDPGYLLGSCVGALFFMYFLTIFRKEGI